MIPQKTKFNIEYLYIRNFNGLVFLGNCLRELRSHLMMIRFLGELRALRSNDMEEIKTTEPPHPLLPGKVQNLQIPDSRLQTIDFRLQTMYPRL